MTALRRRLLEDMQVRHLSPHTQRAYVNNIAQFARHFGQSPAALGPEEIRTYQNIILAVPVRPAISQMRMPVHQLADRYGRDAQLEDIRRRLTCQQCGRRPERLLSSASCSHNVRED